MVDYNEGISLALSAVAENLKKSNDLHEQTSSYFQKVLKKQVEEDEKEHMLTEEEEEKKSFNNMVEAISNSVITKVQKDLIAPLAKQLEDLAGDKAKKVSGTKWPMSSNDSPGDKEKTASMENKTEKGTQMAIEAMKKQESASPVLTVKASPDSVTVKKDDVEENGADEYPVEEKPVEEVLEEGKEEYNEYMVKLQKLEKEMISFKKNQGELVEKEVNKRMEKMGVRKEVLRSPQLTKSLGLNQVPIIKTEEGPENLVDKLSSMSWSDIVDLKLATFNESPNLPTELKSLKAR